MNIVKYIPLCTGMIILLVGCTQPENKENDPSQNEAVHTEKAEERPPQTEGILMIEGMREPVTLNLYKSPETFPLAFSTYVPEDMQAEEISSEDGRVIRILSAFGGTVNHDAFLQIKALPANTGTEKARENIRSVVQQMQGISAEEDRSRHPWAEVTYTLRGDRAGFLSLARYAGKWFYIRLQYPPEYGDGMAPRSAMILDQWRWNDTGDPLKNSR